MKKFPVHEIMYRQKYISEAQQRIKQVVGSVVGFCGNVRACFNRVGHIHVTGDNGEGWTIDVEPLEADPRNAHVVKGVMYVFESRTVFEYRPNKSGNDRFEFCDLQKLPRVDDALQGFVDEMAARVPTVNAGLEALFASSKSGHH